MINKLLNSVKNFCIFGSNILRNRQDQESDQTEMINEAFLESNKHELLTLEKYNDFVHNENNAMEEHINQITDLVLREFLYGKIEIVYNKVMNEE